MVGNKNGLFGIAQIYYKKRPRRVDFYIGAGSRTRTYEARRREIYSLLSLPLDDSSNTNIIT